MPFRSVCVSFSLSFFGSFLGCMCRRVEVDSVCCVSVRSALAPATHTMGSRSKKRKKKVGLEIYDDLPPETAISNQTNGRIVCYYCARSHTRRAQHGTAHTTHIPKKSRPSIFNRMACFSSTLPHNSFKAFFHFQFGLISTPNSDQKLFPPTH